MADGGARFSAIFFHLQLQQTRTRCQEILEVIKTECRVTVVDANLSQGWEKDVPEGKRRARRAEAYIELREHCELEVAFGAKTER